MNSFVRFVLVLIAVGVVMNLSLVLYSNYRSQKRQAVAVEEEKARLEAVVQRFDDRQRRMDMLVEWQKTDARGKVIETSLLLRRYRIAEVGELSPMPLTRVVVPGDRVCVDGLRLTFDALFDGNYKFLRNVQLSFFDKVYAENQPEKDRFSFQTPYQVPASTRIYPDKPSPTHFELQLWNRVWELIQNPQRAAKQGLRVIRDVPACRTVKNGTLYSVYLGLDGLAIELCDEPGLQTDILREAATDIRLKDTRLEE